MPGERSGELQLLSPGKKPAVVPAAPQNIPLPSQPRTDVFEEQQQSTSPFQASSSALQAGKTQLADIIQSNIC